MPISKKDRRAREQKAAEAAGTRAQLTSSGVPVKPAKAKIQCKICKVEIEKEKTAFLKQHAEAKHPKATYDDCFAA
ncbi:hypothetical protein P389DRAFT_194215 [Cystobasidium minutum MCA 4210]|uniref:uncharacterized protein n=1 Tax=Cystobasidium minutum MCA 4210 TaxID=1397322 RepID=UPI0034CE6226|eukprot:jgi/Rhomi1/194215/gm1.2429_g